MATIIYTPSFMTILGKAIIIEPDWKKIKEVKIKLGSLKKKEIMIASIHCLNDKFLKIKELTEKPSYLKIFHDGKEEDFNNMLSVFEIQERKDKDVMYINGAFDNRSIADCYQKYFFKFFPRTFSSVFSSGKEER